MAYTEYGYAAFAEHGTPSPFLHVDSVKAHARDVREYMGAAWAHDEETPRQGWKRAYRAGWRVAPVIVRLRTDC